jgi:ribosomal protein L34E
MWLTEINGMERLRAIAFAKLSPTVKEPIRPGPAVEAMASN